MNCSMSLFNFFSIFLLVFIVFLFMLIKLKFMFPHVTRRLVTLGTEHIGMLGVSSVTHLLIHIVEALRDSAIR